MRLRATPTEIVLRFDSDITFVDHAVEILRTLLGHQGQADPTSVLLVSRELLKNAVVHGNRNDPSREVRHRVAQLRDGRFRVETHDEGQGFDHGCLPRRGMEPTAAGPRPGRGYSIILSVADEVIFGDRGNSVVVYVGANR